MIAGVVRAFCLAALLCAAPAAAAEFDPAVPALQPQRTATPFERRAALDEAARLLEQDYVDPALGRALAALLRAEDLRPGLPDETFLQAVNTRLYALSGDRHLLLYPAPETPPTLALAAQPAAAPFLLQPDDPARPVEVDWRWLGPGVDYLRLSELRLTPASARRLDRAFAVLGDARALVIDLRDCPGGTDEAVNYVASRLFEDATLLTARQTRDGGRYDLRTVPLVGALPELPVYVLVGPETASAAEALAFALQRTGRAVLVGERTAGAGNYGRRVELPGGYALFLPFVRTFDPDTGRGWEGVGVRPDLELPAERALAFVRAVLGGDRLA